MLRLEKIVKTYKVADQNVEALKGLDLVFRKNEFVSILGPSGCGKTTTLNIIGGLDRYTSGDLWINGRSTKDFKDLDWDVYRNHRVGFIFQSYNLIPHQTILGNVELALTISGISKEERIARAKKAIDKVGLEGQYNKRPNQLSGGQCQRVAIARALVNEPEILLADEPTGALDTVTSIQIMELIKEIAKERLVIMVTHNPDLAQQYSNRIIRLLDGQLISDTNPFTKEEEDAELALENKALEKKEEEKASNVRPVKEKAKMSFFTAFKLSLRNLFTKKARTALICVAGSIGIIGVSSVLAVSSGVQGYITSMQDDMLSGNPVKIDETGYDLNAMMSGMSMSDKKEALDIIDGYVNVDSMIEYLVSRSASASAMQINNNITQEYIDYVKTIDPKFAAAITFDYGIDVTNNIYTNFKVNNSDTTTQNISLSAIRTIYTSLLKETEYAQYANYITSLTNVFKQIPSDEAYVSSQYDLVSGSKIASEENEIMIVIDEDSELTDLLLAQLGYYTQEEFFNLVYRATNKNDPNYNPIIDKNRFSYEELIGKTFSYYPNDTVYTENQNNPLSPFSYNYDSSTLDSSKKEEFVITGILKPKKEISYGCLTSGFFYTEAFTNKFIEEGLKSKLAAYLNTVEKTVFTSGEYNGMPSGITYKYSYQSTLKDDSGNPIIKKDVQGYVGTTNAMADILGGMMGTTTQEMYTLTLRELGGSNLANSISIYPVDFDLKSGVIEHLDRWNSDETITFERVNASGNTESITLTGSQRDKITYSDNIAVMINMINSLISLVTTALIAFTCLSLVVSCFMIAIITYVSVVERVKEIGVIRSLGGRKKDVTHLFNAETFIIGLIAGVFGVAFTYLISLVLNLIVQSFTGIYPIANLPFWQALIMICISVLLTVVSGIIPARSAAKKDPVVALRTE